MLGHIKNAFQTIAMNNLTNMVGTEIVKQKGSRVFIRAENISTTWEENNVGFYFNVSS